ncbi:MAG: SH3 domain-containing protein [Spirochaetales bacterium]|nr:SH3 domain-containing protein [Spirochaetales bacterium]
MKTQKQFHVLIICFFVFFFPSCPDESSGGDDPAGGQGTFKYVTAELGLRLRAQPTIESAALGLIPYKTKVEVLDIDTETVTIGDTKGKWNKVKWGEITGWAFDGFLSFEPVGGNMSINPGKD